MTFRSRGCVSLGVTRIQSTPVFRRSSRFFLPRPFLFVFQHPCVLVLQPRDPADAPGLVSRSPPRPRDHAVLHLRSPTISSLVLSSSFFVTTSVYSRGICAQHTHPREHPHSPGLLPQASFQLSSFRPFLPLYSIAILRRSLQQPPCCKEPWLPVKTAPHCQMLSCISLMSKTGIFFQKMSCHRHVLDMSQRCLRISQDICQDIFSL